ncbi:hypothetical protein PG988_004894 [Apiospora saccharicola]
MQNVEVVEDDGGLLAVSLRLTFPPGGRWRGDAGGNWTSTYGGKLHNLHICDRCHSDLEYHVEVVGREARVRFTCSRDLGAATERFLPKWHVLQALAGSYCFRVQQYHYDATLPSLTRCISGFGERPTTWAGQPSPSPPLKNTKTGGDNLVSPQDQPSQLGPEK